MRRISKRFTGFFALGAILSALLALSLACAAAEPTPTPVPPAPPAPPLAPTATPAPTIAPAPAAPTAAPIAPAPTRTLPTATPVVTGKIQYGGNLRFAYNLNVSTLDTHFSRELSDRPIYYAMYNSVVGYDTDFSILPELAKSWEISSDGKGVTFTLQKGIKFHNGEEFNAQVVKWNFDRMLDPTVGTRLRSTLTPYLNGVTVVDSERVTFNMKYPYRPLLSDLGDRPGFILPPKAVQELGGGDEGRFSKRGIGTGAFKFVEWVPQRHLILERNADYWEKGKPYLDRITFLDVPDASVRLAMLRTSEVEVIDGIRPQDVSVIQANPRLRVAKFDTGRWAGLNMSIDREPWSIKDMRMAIGSAIDRETLSKTYYGGGAVPAYSSEGGTWAFDPTIKVYEYNPQKAKELLAKAGYPNGLTMPIWCASTAADIELCEIYQAMMGAVGIKLDIKLVPASDTWALFLDRKTHFGPTTWGPRADPHGRLFRINHKDGASNPPKFNNPEVNRLLDEAVQIYDINKAKPLYSKAERIIAEEGWHIYTVFITWFAAEDKKIQNYKIYPDLMQRFKEVWMEK